MSLTVETSFGSTLRPRDDRETEAGTLVGLGSIKAEHTRRHRTHQFVALSQLNLFKDLIQNFPKRRATDVSMKTPDTKAKLLNNISLSKHLSSKKGGSRTSNCGNCLEFSVLTRLSSVP